MSIQNDIDNFKAKQAREHAEFFETPEQREKRLAYEKKFRDFFNSLPLANDTFFGIKRGKE